ncbi:hypothetical protein ACHAWF_007594 [Thalassiosira exigua]
MYTNINTDEFLDRLSRYLHFDACTTTYPHHRVEALIEALTIVMRNNRMRFDPVTDAELWQEFRAAVNNGSLRWEFTRRSHSMSFMDVKIYICERPIGDGPLRKETRPLFVYPSPLLPRTWCADRTYLRQRPPHPLPLLEAISGENSPSTLLLMPPQQGLPESTAQPAVPSSNRQRQRIPRPERGLPRPSTPAESRLKPTKGIPPPALPLS